MTAIVPVRTSIAAGQALSGPVASVGYGVCLLLLPAAWTDAPLTLQGSLDEGEPAAWADLHDHLGNEVVLTVAAGRALTLSPTHAVKNGRRYCYYVAQRVLKADAVVDDRIVRRVSAAQIEGAVISQVRALLRQPEIVVGTWLAARRDMPDLTEREVRDALHRLDPLWDELFPAEQARIVRVLVERVVVGPAGADIRLRLEGLGGLVRDLGAIAPEVLRSAA